MVEYDQDQRAARAVRKAREVGIQLAHNETLAEKYREGSTLVELAEEYVSFSDAHPHVAQHAVWYALKQIIPEDEFHEIGREHMKNGATERGRKAVEARGEVPYHSTAVEINGEEYYEDEFIAEMRGRGKYTWQEITKITNENFSHLRPDRSLRAISGHYQRNQKDETPRQSYKLEKRKTSHGKIFESEFILKRKQEGETWQNITNEANSLYEGVRPNRSKKAIKEHFKRKQKKLEELLIPEGKTLGEVLVFRDSV